MKTIRETLEVLFILLLGFIALPFIYAGRFFEDILEHFYFENI